VDAKSVLDEAAELVGGARRAAYGDPEILHSRVAMIWSGILGVHVTTEQVLLCMAGLKIGRESLRPKRDNIVDAAGYLKLLGDVSRPD
jgi:hypothetical protein